MITISEISQGRYHIVISFNRFWGGHEPQIFNVTCGADCFESSRVSKKSSVRKGIRMTLKRCCPVRIGRLTGVDNIKSLHLFWEFIVIPQLVLLNSKMLVVEPKWREKFEVSKMSLHFQ